MEEIRTYESESNGKNENGDFVVETRISGFNHPNPNSFKITNSTQITGSESDVELMRKVLNIADEVESKP